MTRLETSIDTSTADSVERFLKAHNTPKTPSTDALSISRLLQNKPELPGFIEAWRSKPVSQKHQTIEEIASYCAETLSSADPYRFLFTPSGELFSPTDHCLVKEIIKTHTHVGKLEYEAFKKTEQIMAANKKGIIIWLSPLDPEEYPDDSKIVVSEIEEKDGVKTLFNRAIVLDIDQKTCVKLAQDLANYSINKPSLLSADEVRSNPLLLDPDGEHWTYILEKLIANLNLQDVREGEDIVVKEKLLQQAVGIYNEFFGKRNLVSAETIARQMSSRDMIGASRTSCPKRTAFNVFAENAKEVGSNCEKVRCRRCGWEPNPGDEKKMESGELTSCPARIKGENGEEKICGWAPGQPV